jgi:hypothetical protein
MRARSRTEPLKESIKVIHGTSVVAVEINFGVFGRHLEPNSGARIDMISVRGIRRRVPDLCLDDRRGNYE